MKKHAISPDELYLLQLAEAGKKLNLQKKALEDSMRKLEAEHRDRESTLPPSDIVSARQKQKHYEEVVPWQKYRNFRRKQEKSLLLLVLLIAMTTTVIWWGLKIMHGP